MTLAQPVAPSPISPLRMSEEEYLAWVTEEMSTEWVAGEVIFKMPISELHDLLQRAIAASLEALVRRKTLGHVRGDKWAMRLPQHPSWREADIIFVANENAHRLSKSDLRGPADLAIELVSPDSISRDHRIKFAEYQAAGIREYWIVDLLAKVVEGHRLNEAGLFEPIIPDDAGRLHSRVVPGWWLETAVLFNEPTPDAIELARLLGVI